MAFAQSAYAQSTVAGGGAFTLVVKGDGSLWAFGLNNNGQLADNSVTTRRAPQQIAGLSNIQAVAAGGVHALALTSGGAVYAFGDNLYGQIGDSSNTDRKTPVLLGLSNVVAIAAGEFHSLALTSSGQVFAWGRNQLGQLGTGNTTNVNTPTLILSDAIAIGAGRNHSLAVKSDGTAVAWGANASGQLGNNTTSTGATSSPVQMLGITSASQIAGGEAHSFIILSDGTLKGAGENGAGQLADGTSTDRWTAITIGSLGNVAQVATGLDHAFARLGDGSVVAWGENSGGELGLGPGNTADQRSPVDVTSLSAISAIAAGWSHSIAVDASGVVATWGANASSQLGDGTTLARAVPTPISDAAYDWRVATPVFNPASGTFTADKPVVVTVDTAGATIRYTQNGDEPTESDSTITSGSSVTVTTSQTLKARAWKSGMPASETATATIVLQVATPTVSPTATTYTTPQNVTMSTTTPGATLRYTTDGTDPTESSSAYSGPIPVANTTTFRIAGFKSGWSTSSLRISTYTMNFGTLAAPTVDPATGVYEGSVSVTMSSPQSGATIRYTTNNTAPTASSPVYTAPIAIATTTTIRAKVFHPNYTTSVETARTYTLTAHTPVLSTAPGSYAPGSTVTITAGQPATDTLRMTIDGSDPTTASPTIASGTTLLLGNFTLKVKAWRTGATDSAVGSATYTLTGPMGPGSAATGDAHSVLATPDGRVLAWGESSDGQLGIDSTTDRLVPTLLNTITGVTAVAAGLAHTLAITADGQLFAWGENASGRLGDGTVTQRNRPVHIATLNNVTAVAAGDAHSLALTNDGRLFAWGANASGQLGLGSTTGALTPTEIPALSNVVAIAAGDNHSMAVTAAGQLFAWGLNTNSRLGDGTTTMRTSPVLIDLGNVVAVAAGAAHSLALTGDGRLFSWGLGSNGQLGRGTTASSATPTVIPDLYASAIAAGDTFSAAIRHDGALVAWGLNSSGQIGDSTTTQRTSPVPVSGPASVTTLALGDTHSLVVTPEGEAWTWGAGASGRLGDGGTANRATPQAILAGLSDWQPAAPTLSEPSGTLTEPQLITVQSSTSGSTIRYTTNGADPTGADADVPGSGAVEIAFSSLFRARVFAADRFPSPVARADYELQSPAPVIQTPPGTYTTAQEVTITAAGPPSTIRYTLDGSEPTASSTAYAGSFVVNTATTIKARAFPSNGWAPSAAASATLTFNYGTLAAPTASPDGGVYADALQVTLSAISGATIRYTVNGSEPTVSSALYTSPVTVNSGIVTLKARAFHPDWTESAAGTQTYTIDLTPPTIGAERFPLPIGNWHLTPVALTFVCTDSVGIATCSPPSTISTEGAGQIVSGTAVDQVGREATAQETVNVDLTPPLVTLTAPVDGLVTASSSVEVSAQVSDALSGLGIVNCNGVATPVVNGIVTCTATLRPGRNAITVSARDVAGHSSSQGAMVTLASTPTSITLSPANRTMLVGETATLSLRDDFGMPVPGATWVSSNANIVALSPDDPPVLTTLAEGTVTITATRNGLASASTITVVAGTSLPDGTTQWRVAPTSGSTGSWFEGPIYTNRIDESGPDLFMVETNTTTWERRLRAISATGEVDWLTTSPGVPLMGDTFGGVIAGVEPSPNHCMGPFNEIHRCYVALTRFAGPPGTASWRYDSPGLVDRPAQGPDGTIYVVEHLGDHLYEPNNTGNAFFPYPGEKALVILDGATGEVTARVPLAGNLGYEPVTVGPIVGSDGFGYILLTKGSGLTLHRMDREGQVAEQVVAGCAGCSTIPQQLMPDGMGGLLIVASWNTSPQGPAQRHLVRFDAVGERTDHLFGNGRIEMIGRGGTAHVSITSGVPIVSQPVMDILTWTPRWNLPLEWSLLAARADGGAVAQNEAGDQAHFDGSGQLLGTIPAVQLRNPVHHLGGWVGASGLAPNTPSGLRKIEGTFEDATYFNGTYAPKLWTGVEQYGFGNGLNQSASPIVPKISVKCRPVGDAFPISSFDHCYIVVKNQDGSMQTIEGSEEEFRPIGTLVAAVKPGDAVSPNRPTDPVFYYSNGDSEDAVIDCLKTNTTAFHAMRLDYHFLGPNSNRFVVEVMGSCGRTVRLPWKAIGAEVPFNPPIQH